MKVLKVGTIPKPQEIRWPIDVEITCSFCRCRFIPETEFDYSLITERYPDGRRTALLDCPTCNRGIALDRTQEVL